MFSVTLILTLILVVITTHNFNVGTYALHHPLNQLATNQIISIKLCPPTLQISVVEICVFLPRQLYTLAFNVIF